MKIYIRAAIIDALDLDPATQREVASDPNTSPEVLAHMAQSEHFPILKLVALNPSTDENTLLMLADMSDDLCGYIANNRNATPRVISKLIDICNDLDTLRNITNRSDLTADMLTKLAHKAVETRAWQIAIPLVTNPNLSESDLLTLLDYDTHSHAIMDPIIRHPNVTLEVLQQLLIKDAGYCGYMKDILKFHQVPEEFLWEFIHNGTKSDRRAIANSTQASSEMLSELIRTDNDVWVSGDAIKNPNLSEEDIWDVFNSDRASNLVWNPNCPSEILAHFADKWISEDNKYSISEVAKHANTPIDSLYQIFDAFVESSSWPSPIWALAANPNLPNDLAAEIANSSDDRAKESLAGNPNVSPDILGSLVKSKIDIRKALAKNPNTPPKALIKLAKDRSDEVKYIVGENPNLPEEGYLRLLQDPRAYCRWGLEHNPTYKERYAQERER
jgi:hypothetical protein